MEASNINVARVLKKHQDKNPEAILCISIKQGHLEIDWSPMGVQDICYFEKILSLEIAKVVNGDRAKLIP